MKAIDPFEGPQDLCAEGRKKKDDIKKAFQIMGLIWLVAIFSIIFYAIQSSGKPFAIVGVGLMLTGAAGITGGILGFLFGIPRALQQRNELAARRRDESDQTGTPSLRAYGANTNLEEISDWLTKILVGVGLTQVHELLDRFDWMTARTAAGLGDGMAAQVYAAALLCYSVVAGFLFGYLFTRIYLPAAFTRADSGDLREVVEKVGRAEAKVGDLRAVVEQVGEKAEANLREAVEKVSEKAETNLKILEEIKEKAEHDSRALLLAYRQLNPDNLPKVDPDALNSAVTNAARQVRSQIFYRAWSQRRDNRLQDKQLVELTIPVFRALIASDRDDLYHTNHGQLGFALMDKAQPDWEEADAELSRAIRIRNERGDSNWLLYEFCRAVCRINIDLNKGSRSSPDRGVKILDDLRIAKNSEKVKKIMETDDRIQKWLALNQVNAQDLAAG